MLAEFWRSYDESLATENMKLKIVFNFTSKGSWSINFDFLRTRGVPRNFSRGGPTPRGGARIFFSYIFDFWEVSKNFSHPTFNLEGGVRWGPDPIPPWLRPCSELMIIFLIFNDSSWLASALISINQINKFLKTKFLT